MTTVAGLFPILLETSFQAQILIPMAASICFGLIAATVLVLVLIPVFYYLYARYIHEVFTPGFVSEDEQLGAAEVCQQLPLGEGPVDT